jgi:hypothetical protein
MVRVMSFSGVLGLILSCMRVHASLYAAASSKALAFCATFDASIVGSFVVGSTIVVFFVATLRVVTVTTDGISCLTDRWLWDR